jgi:pimeloyl-ACP methyl ester carboxylesterase
MTATAVTGLNGNSTNVRSTRQAPLLIRTWFGLLGRLAPSVAERQAANLFLTPRTRKGPTPTELHETLLPERAMERRAGEAEPAFPELPTGRVALWSWGRGPVALFVHGWSGNAGDMAPLAAEFVRAGYRAVLFDMPGHGDSAPRPTNLLVYMRTIAAVAELTGAVDTLVGHSLGGTATALAVGQRLVTPKRAVLVAPGVSPWAFSVDFARLVGLPAARVAGMVAVTEGLVGAKAHELNAAEAVRQSGVPAYIVHDPADLDVPYAHATELSAAWQGSTLLPRPGLGHRKILKDAETARGVIGWVGGSVPGA